MVNLTLNKQRLFADLGMKENDQFYHTLAMMGLEVESIEKDEIVIDVTPNRPDLLSQIGVTRALLAFLGKKSGLREYQTTKSKLKVRIEPAVKPVRPYTACAVVRKLSLDAERLRELIDIQEKLHITFCRRRKRAAIGIYPMEAISGNITYTALPKKEIRFRPLDAQKEMSAEQILKEHPKGKEYAHLLNGLELYPVFMDAKKNILSLVPIINSHLTGKVTEKTKEVFIEASGHDQRICNEIVQMITAAFADMGAEIQTVEIVSTKKSEFTPDMRTRKQEFYGYYVNKKLGLTLTKEQFAKLLGKVGIGFEDGRIRETHYALLPPYRVDFLHQIDVVEDIGIAYGYENLTPIIPEVATVAKESSATLFADKLRSILSGLTLLEAKNYHLLSREYQQKLSPKGIVTLKSCVSEEYDSLRNSLLPCLLQTFARNKMHEYPQGFFEIGVVFAPQETSVHEHNELCIALSGDVDYTKIRQHVDALVHALGLTGRAVFTPAQDERFLSGRCAHISINDTVVGVLGEVAPYALSLVGVTMPTAAAEIDLGLLESFLKDS